MRPSPRLDRLAARLNQPVDPSSLVAFRIAFGLIMVWEAYRYLSKGRVEHYYIDPPYHFTYPFFDWVGPWPGDWMYVHFYALGALGLMIAAGAAYRIATTLFFLGFTYVFLLERANYLNHFYLVCLLSFLMILVPAHRAFSVDALLRPRLRRTQVPAWAIWLLRFQVGVPYFFGGIAKLDADWLRGEPMRSWLAARTDFPLVGGFFTEEWAVYAATYYGVLLDLFVVPLLLWRRTRPYAFAAALAFHLINAKLFSIGIFPWLMLAATTIFFEPDWPRRLLGRAPAPAAGEPPAALGRGALAALGLWAAIQVLVPLRPFLYPGKASWTEEGHTFSWHMKLRSKSGTVDFYAVDGRTGARQQMHHDVILTDRQLRKMSTRPYLIQHFARHIATELAARGFDHEVRVDSVVSLNGRRPQRMIDPDVNLGAEPRRVLRRVPWILPLEIPLGARRSRNSEMEIE